MVYRHTEPIPSFSAYLMLLITKNPPEIWFSDRMQPTLVESQEPNTLDKRRTNPIVVLVTLAILTRHGYSLHPVST
jgi:hypothetical protein